MITFLDLHDYGRFGNRLFMIAGTIGIALKNGYQYGFGEWEEANYFVNPLPELSQKFTMVPKQSWRKYTYKVPFYYDPDLVPPDNSILFGFMQTDGYFKQYRDTICRYFELKPFPGLEPIDTNSIAIHFRGTDYRTVNFPICTREYYLEALSRMPGKIPIYVFSDEVQTVKDMFEKTKYSKRITYMPVKHYIHDFILMKSCRHFIISNSTYAWWGAWLGNQKDKRVIAPSNWYAKTIPTKPGHIYADGWEII